MLPFRTKEKNQDCYVYTSRSINCAITNWQAQQTKENLVNVALALVHYGISNGRETAGNP
jgi:hypothetical protein